MLPVSVHRYTLVSKSGLNARSARREHCGALLRVGDGSRGAYGYGCIHPWPELGDAGLDETLEALAGGVLTPLSCRALECAEADAAARAGGVSLFAGLAVPPSHATLVMDGDAVRAAVEAGFGIVKLKVGKDLPEEKEFICGQSARFPRLRWRLDFNGVLTPGELDGFLAGLGGDVRERIDFLEDACVPGGGGAGGVCGIPLAVDRGVEVARGGFDVAVVKPALNRAEPILGRAAAGGMRVVFTSYMDHPLGQCFAAWEAAVAAESYPSVVDVCGLVTQGLFEANPFSEWLGEPRPEFRVPAGTGLGFDALLEDLPWTRLR